MDADRWNRLSAWHNAWLAAGPADRQQLRERLTVEQPDLVAEVDAILAASASLEGFLEEPAFLTAAKDLADEPPALAQGTAVGPYEVVELIARGGMGDVYRARDRRLNRDVALKVLTHAEHYDSRSIARFEQEARVTASLDHPNVVKIYDTGSFEGRPYLVAEMLVGETLRSRLTRQAIDPGEACRITVDVARGLVAAHGAGLVHRDLKPENIFLTRSGTTKILDFGIAKLVDQEPPRPDSGLTFTGTLLGTAGYLAPEQIEGRSVDGRADLFSLGSIAFEMLTGRRAFARETTIDTMYAIVHDPPPDLLEQRPDLPATIDLIVTRLLEKRPEARFQTAADLVWTLERVDALPLKKAQSERASAVSAHATSSLWPLLWIATGVGVTALAGWAIWAPAAAPAGSGSPVQFTWSLPQNLTLGSEPAVSPDGRRVVFSGLSGTGSRLYVRELSSFEVKPIDGTERAKQPFWSPDSSAVGFFANGRLKRVNLAGGPPVDLASAPDARGGAWSPAGVIVFQSFFRDRGLSQVSIDGGDVRPATTLDTTSPDTTPKWPVFLPDGDHFLYQQLSLDESRRGIHVGRLSDPSAISTRPLLRADSGALYVAPNGSEKGHLLVVEQDRIRVWPFDAHRVAIVGDPQTLSPAVAGATLHVPAMLGASTRLLAFAAVQLPSGGHFASVDLDGRNLEVRPQSEVAGARRLSPNGTRIARSIADPITGDADVWVEELTRQTPVRVTTSRDLDLSPVWSPDGQSLAYRSGPWNASNLSIAAADGTGVLKVFSCPGEPCHPTDWSPDETWIAVNANDDVWKVDVTTGTATAFITGSSTQSDARVSSDGQWLAYTSNESGRPEVYIRTLSTPVRRIVVSSGGSQPVWHPAGSSLFYVSLDDHLQVVPIRRSADGSPIAALRISTPVGRFGPSHFGTTYDVSADGQRVYFAHPGDAPRPREIGFMLDWTGLVSPPRR